MAHEGNGRSGGRSGSTSRDAGQSLGSVGEEVAHVRARFAVDPSTPARWADAWKAPSGTIEEDESELIDAVADCLSVGLPIDAAVASWRSGSLQVSAEDAENDGDDGDETSVFGDDDDTAVYDPRAPTGRRRIVQS
jgi:hypothetical protein